MLNDFVRFCMIPSDSIRSHASSCESVRFLPIPLDSFRFTPTPFGFARCRPTPIDPGRTRPMPFHSSPLASSRFRQILVDPKRFRSFQFDFKRPRPIPPDSPRFLLTTLAPPDSTPHRPIPYYAIDSQVSAGSPDSKKSVVPFGLKGVRPILPDSSRFPPTASEPVRFRHPMPCDSTRPRSD